MKPEKKKTTNPKRDAPYPTYTEAFTEVQIAIDKAHKMLEKAFNGDISLKEAQASARVANRAISESRKKIAAMRRAPKK